MMALPIYRSLTNATGILQMLGCIPRTPSPTPQNSRVEEAMVKTDDPQEELRALRVSILQIRT